MGDPLTKALIFASIGTEHTEWEFDVHRFEHAILNELRQQDELTQLVSAQYIIKMGTTSAADALRLARLVRNAFQHLTATPDHHALTISVVLLGDLEIDDAELLKNAQKIAAKAHSSAEISIEYFNFQASRIIYDD